jgi:hypothetical protein
MPTPDANLIKSRLLACLLPLSEFIDCIIEDSTGETDFVVRWLPTEEDARTIAECLLHLGLEGDARRLSQSWVWLSKYKVGPQFEAWLVGQAKSSEEEAERLRMLFGPFPTADEFASSRVTRGTARMQAISLSRDFGDQLKQLVQTFCSASVAGREPSAESPNGSIKGEPGSRTETQLGNQKPKKSGPKPIFETDLPRYQVLQAVDAARRRFGGPKKALEHLENDAEFVGLKQQIREVGEVLNEALLDNARKRCKPRD